MSAQLAKTFEQLYMENVKKIYRLALGLTGKADIAEEITQEAFFRAFRAFNTYRADSSFFTWIYRITLNVSNDYMRQMHKVPVQALTEDMGYILENIIDPNPKNNPEYEVLAREARYKCLHCLTECLPIEQRKIFCLAITLGMPHKMVAEIMECSLSKVKTTLHRAKKRWFGYMENRCEIINKSNPCKCTQWVKFGLEQGWISKEPGVNPRPEIDLKAVREIRKLNTLQSIYMVLYPENKDEMLVDRIREGLKNKEWSILS